MQNLLPKFSYKPQLENDEKKAEYIPKMENDYGYLKEEINSNILDDLVLKEINKNGLPNMTADEMSSAKRRMTLQSLNWNSSEFRYFLSQIYQDKCKKFLTLTHLQGRKFAERNNHIAILEAKAKKL